MSFRGRHPHSTSMSHGLTVILLAAFMLRALIPTGWMPLASDTDGMTLVICTVAGLQEVTIGPDGHPQPSDDTSQASGHEPCPFAAAVKFTPPALAAILITPANTAGVAPVAHEPAPPSATHLRLAESRAPPVLG